MGQEIDDSHFRFDSFRRFYKSLRDETRLLLKMIHERSFSSKGYCIGLELELCLIDSNGMAQPKNETALSVLADGGFVPEIAKFNVELNVEPAQLDSNGISKLAQRLSRNLDTAREKLKVLELSLVSIGILPTLSERDVSMENMSPAHRYHALNEQVIRLRRGRPTRLEISGIETLRSEHLDVMLEAAATSLQLHLQVPQHEAALAYNLSLLLSAPMVALGANSPFLFGKKLWLESRVPLFEQAVAMESPLNRVHFGTGFAKEDLGHLFEQNASLYPVLLPLTLEQPVERFPHLRLQNGTIWRWNRPLVGFDESGSPHFRIEHRVMGASPSVIDTEMDMAFFYGWMIYAINKVANSTFDQFPFISAWTNFYDAARIGFKAHTDWIDGKRWILGHLLLEKLIPEASEGLSRIGVEESLNAKWMQGLVKRVESGRTGAQWQIDFQSRTGCGMSKLTAEYVERQRSNQPVHEWEV